MKTFDIIAFLNDPSMSDRRKAAGIMDNWLQRKDGSYEEGFTPKKWTTDRNPDRSIPSTYVFSPCRFKLFFEIIDELGVYKELCGTLPALLAGSSYDACLCHGFIPIRQWMRDAKDTETSCEPHVATYNLSYAAYELNNAMGCFTDTRLFELGCIG